MLDEVMRLLPGEVRERPLAHTRYLWLGERPSRITVFFSTAGMRPQVGFTDRIFPALPEGVRQRDPTLAFHALSYCLAGQARLRGLQPEAQWVVNAGECFQFNDESSSQLQVLPGPDFAECSVSIEGGLCQHLLALGVWRPQVRLAHLGLLPALVLAYRDLAQAIADPAVGSPGLIRRLLLVLELAYAGIDAAGGDFRQRACRTLEAHPEPGFTVAEAAAELGMGVESFRRRFAAELGLSPGAWHQRARMQRALTLLPEHGVTATAHVLGYADATAFSRQFAQVMGTRPGTFSARRGRRQPP